MSTDGPAPRPVGVHFDGDLKRALIDAAVAELDEVGADRLSLRSVARRIGVSHGAPAHHFRDKTGLLTAVAIEGYLAFMDHMVIAFAGVASDTSPRSRARALVSYVEFALDHPGQFEVMFRPQMVDHDDPTLAAISEMSFDGLVGHIASLQSEDWQHGVDPAAIASGSWALAHGIAVLAAGGAFRRRIPEFRSEHALLMAEVLLGSSGPTGPTSLLYPRVPGTDQAAVSGSEPDEV